MEHSRILILGAGIAGASTAWHLMAGGARNVLVVDMEEVGDRHSTGRNAAILRTAIPDPSLHALARESLSFFQSPPYGFSMPPLLNPTGLILAAGASQCAELNAWIQRQDCALNPRELDTSELTDCLPHLLGHAETSWLFKDEGVLDVAAIHQAFLHGARRKGAEFAFGVKVEQLSLAGGKMRGIQTSLGPIEADVVVMAAGAWAESLAATQNLELPLTPKRRHLLATTPLPQVDPNTPVFWATGPDFYCRPESGGLLLCGCDEIAVDPDEGELQDDTALELLFERVEFWMPEIANLATRSWWAGARTFAQDGRFVLGPDPRVAGLHWAAGLGGHGITCSPAVGKILADAILQGHAVPQALSANRFATARSSA